jgi:hypothetical protein
MGTQAADGESAVPVGAAGQGFVPRDSRAPDHESGQHGRQDPESPHWDLRVEPDGRLTAVLTGTNPPLTVTGDDLASLRKQIKTIVMRAML